MNEECAVPLDPIKSQTAPPQNFPLLSNQQRKQALEENQIYLEDNPINETSWHAKWNNDIVAVKFNENSKELHKEFSLLRYSLFIKCNRKKFDSQTNNWTFRICTRSKCDYFGIWRCRDR
jgi:hypothetical protein